MPPPAGIEHEIQRRNTKKSEPVAMKALASRARLAPIVHRKTSVVRSRRERYIEMACGVEGIHPEKYAWGLLLFATGTGACANLIGADEWTLKEEAPPGGGGVGETGGAGGQGGQGGVA